MAEDLYDQIQRIAQQVLEDELREFRITVTDQRMIVMEGDRVIQQIAEHIAARVTRETM